MIVLRAAEMGMCFGVRDALHVLDLVPDPADVTIHGELVHNPEVLAHLDRRGFHRQAEATRDVPATPVVLVTAHGISDRERSRLQAAGRQLIDTTCPLVTKVHRIAHELAASGHRLVVIGRRDHVEVRGIVEDFADPIVVERQADVATWPDRRLGVVCQTTTQEALAEELVAAIRAANPHAEVTLVDTICSPTRARVAALDDLLRRVEALVVVGGHNSNNTRQLVAAGQRAGLPVVHVANAAELDPAVLRGVRVVGLTAGTSTLATTVDDVERVLRGWSALPQAS